MSEIENLVKFSIRAGAVDKFIALAADCSDHAKKHEPGTISYTWTLADDGSTCHLNQRYTDPSAVAAHMSGHIVTDLLPKLLEMSELTGIDMHGDVPADLEAALEPLPVTFFRPLK